MPNIVDYPIVLDRLTRAGYRSLYYNSGAFGFASETATQSRGWIGPPDGSIRASALPILRRAVEPFDVSMTDAMIAAWKAKLIGPVWLMPKSHWAFELEFGHRDWLPDLLKKIGIDPVKLAPLNTGAAIEFGLTDENALGLCVRQLLNRLIASDFQLVFLTGSTICTIHTRCQLWWTTTDPGVIKFLDALLPADGNAHS